jgi:hypothetical protein
VAAMLLPNLIGLRTRAAPAFVLEPSRRPSSSFEGVKCGAHFLAVGSTGAGCFVAPVASHTELSLNSHLPQGQNGDLGRLKR